MVFVSIKTKRNRTDELTTRVIASQGCARNFGAARKNVFAALELSSLILSAKEFLSFCSGFLFVGAAYAKWVFNDLFAVKLIAQFGEEPARI